MAEIASPLRLAERLGITLARLLAAPRHAHGTSAPTDLAWLVSCLRPADAILVGGGTRFSTGIKYLTQSTESHAALYVGERLGARLTAAGAPACAVEADVVEGVRAVGLDTFDGLHLRVCRPTTRCARRV